jgi:hypothetical protein
MSRTVVFMQFCEVYGHLSRSGFAARGHTSFQVVPYG